MFSIYINNNLSIMDNKNLINVFEVKPVKKQFGFKISAADVFNEFLYLGDEKGTIHSYPIRMGQADVISRNQNQPTRNVCKYKIDKILCYGPISSVLVLAGETLYVVDSALKRSEPLASKISDFAINETFQKQGTPSVVAVTRKKQGFLFFCNPHSKKLQKLENTKSFNVSQVPTGLAYTNNYIILSTKKEYECLDIQKNFALKKGPIQTKYPFTRVIASSQILFFSDNVGLIMSPDFMPKPKDNVPVSRPVVQVTLCGNYCFILFDNSLQIYSNIEKKFSLIQDIPINTARGITNQRPFIFTKDEVYFLYQIPTQTQIRSLLDKCRVEEAIALLIQNSGHDEQKIQELKINSVWPLLKKMQFNKAKEQIKQTNFDIREVILLFPELVGLGFENMNGKSQKTMATMIIQFINEKAQKGKDEENDLKKKSKLFLKEILQFKRDVYLAQVNTGKVKKSFFTSKNSFIKFKLTSVNAQQLLQIIDFTLIKWFFEMGMLHKLEEFLLNNSVINCQKMFFQFEEILKTHPKLYEVPSLKPRMYTAFDRFEQAFQCWKKVAQTSQKQSIVKTACEESVNLLTKFEDRNEVYDKLQWILRLRPETAMSFFAMVPLNFIQPDQIIKKFQQQKQQRYLELYLETIVIDKNTQIQAYHTKLMLLYIDNLFRSHPKQNKEEGKTIEFQEKLIKFRKLQKNPNTKYAAQPIIRKIQKCEWLLQDQIFLYSRQKRHEDALRRYISKSMSKEAQKYCEQNGQKTLTIYFKMLLTMYRSYEASKNNSALLLKKDIVIFLKKYSSNPQLDPLTVLQLIPDQWMLNDFEGVGGIYQFLQSSIIHTLHEKRTCSTAKHLSEMDLLNVQYNLIQAKRAYLRFTIKKKCCICNGHIADKLFVVYPNANVCHQACVKKQKNTVCPITKQDFEKTFKY